MGVSREARQRRQVIVVTHNANLVVNTDADQVIIASSRETLSAKEARQAPRYSWGSGVSSSLDLKAGNNILRLDRFRGIPIETVTPLAFEKGAPASLQQSADRGPNIGIPKRAAFIRNHWQLAARSHSLPNYFMFEANAHCAQDREPKPIEQRQIRKAKSLTHYHDANSPAPNRINGFRRMKRSEVSTRYFAYLRHVAWQGGPQGRVVIMFFTSGEGIL